MGTISMMTVLMVAILMIAVIVIYIVTPSEDRLSALRILTRMLRKQR